MENKQLYFRIIRNAIVILGLCTFLTFLVMKEMLYVYSTLFGGMLSVLGFIAIVLTIRYTSMSGNVKGKFTGAYIFRYLIYFLAMFSAMKAGLNILSILIGFLCINLSIKMNTILTRKEEN